METANHADSKAFLFTLLLGSYLYGWSGKYLHCDDYSGYKKLEGITLCGCLVHAKRKFHYALAANPDNEAAKKGESYIQKLFAVEDYATEKGMSIEERHLLRNDKSKKIFNEFYD